MRFRRGRNPISNSPPPAWWKGRGAKIFGAVVGPATVALVGAWFLWIAGPPQSSPASSSSSPDAAAPSGPPVIVEDVSAGEWDYGSWVYPKALMLKTAQLAALKAMPTGSVRVNQAWITLTIAGNSAAPATINNISIVKHCQAPLARGATLFYVPPGAGSLSTSPVYFNLDNQILLGQYLSKETGHLYSNFFAKQVVTLKYHEPWTFAIFVTTNDHYCQFSFQLSVATIKGPVSETVSDHGRLFSLTADSETMSGTNHVPFSSYAVIYAPTYDSQGNSHLIRVNPATYHGERDPAPFPSP